MTIENEIVDDIVKDDADTIDIMKLFDAVNSKVFDDQDDLLRKDQSFEKFSSFMDLIKSEGDDELDIVGTKKEKDLSDDEVQSELAGDQNASLETDEDTNKNILDTEKELTQAGEVDLEAVQIEENSKELETEQTDDFIDKTETEEAFVPLDVVESSKELAQKFEEKNEEKVSEEQKISPEFELGYQSALQEFETTIAVEKEALSKFFVSLLAIRDDYAVTIEQLIKEKIIELSHEFLGKNIDSFPEDFHDHIKKISNSITNKEDDVFVELNEIDAAALEPVIKSNKFPIIIKQVDDLGRGEFRMFIGKSGYEQRISD